MKTDIFTMLVLAISSINPLSMLTWSVLWQVCSWPRWYLFKHLAWRLEMTSWHETCPRGQVWQAANWQVGEETGSSYTRSQVTKYRVLWNIFEIFDLQWLYECHIFQMQSYDIPNWERFLRDLSRVLLLNSSMLSGAEKLNSTGLQRHDSLFPLTLCPINTLHSFQELMDCCCMEEDDIIYYLNTLWFCSLFALLLSRCPDIPESPISSTFLKHSWLTSWWHVSGES